MNLTDPENVSRADIALLLDISPRQVTRYFKEGLFKQNKRGKYDLLQTNHIFQQYISNGKVQNEMIDSRKKLDDLKARKEELLLKRLEGKSLDLEEVQVVVTSAMQIICTSMDGQAGRLSHELASESDAAVIRQTLLNENRKIRQSAADKLQLLGSIRLDGRSTKTPAVKKPGPVGKRKQSVTKRKRRTRTVQK